MELFDSFRGIFDDHSVIHIQVTVTDFGVIAEPENQREKSGYAHHGSTGDMITKAIDACLSNFPYGTKYTWS